MASISVHLEVPEFIQTGLTDGSMERVGGAIKSSVSDRNEVIAWMRQVGQAGQAVESSGELVENVLRSAGLSAPTVLNLLTSVMPLVNIAMAGYSLLEIIGDIRSQYSEIERIYDRLDDQFWRDRMANLIAALEAGEQMHTVESRDFAVELVGKITDGLLETKEHLRVEFNRLLRSTEFVDRQEQAIRLHALSMQVAVMTVRSWLEIGEENLAVEWLRGVLHAHKERTRLLVSRLLGYSTALYFHESVSEEYFERYLSIESWLRGRRDILRELVQYSRRMFWNEDAIDSLFVIMPVNRKELINDPFYVRSIPLAEVAIENYQRLEGFDLELK